MAGGEDDFHSLYTHVVRLMIRKMLMRNRQSETRYLRYIAIHAGSMLSLSSETTIRDLVTPMTQPRTRWLRLELESRPRERQNIVAIPETNDPSTTAGRSRDNKFNER